MRLRSAAIALACAASLGRWAGPRPALRVYSGSGQLLATAPAAGGFALSFIHSINLTPVDEEFSVSAGGELVLERMLFDQLSTGMPSGDEDGFELAGGRFATRPGRRYGSISLRVSPVPGHVLSAGGRVRPLSAWAPPGGLLELRAAETP